MNASFTCATWNVNSIRARFLCVQDFLMNEKPDVVLLQETKCQDVNFPFQEIEDLGYNIAHFGQKTYNGVAILSRHPMDEIHHGLDGFSDDQARYVEAGISIDNHYIKVASVYVPNGQEVGSEKYEYKLEFLNHLHQHLLKSFPLDELGIIGGDFNIAPKDSDVYNPTIWYEKVLCSIPERKEFFRLLHHGYTDLLGELKPGTFTWWDYRGGAFEKNEGLRIDHLLATPKAADKVKDAWVMTHYRNRDKASDHAPVLCTLTL